MRPGALVAYLTEDDRIECAVVAGEERGGRLVVVTCAGEPARVPGGRVLEVLQPPGETPAATPEGRRRAAQRAREAAAVLERHAAEVDVEALWSLAQEEDPSAAWSLETLAELALGRSDPAARIAVAKALQREPTRFVRRREGWRPRTAAQLQALAMQRRREQEREAARAQARERVLAALGGGSSAGEAPELEQEWIADLERVALDGASAPASVARRVRGLLREAGIASDDIAEGAFRALRKLGRFGTDDENLEILRYGLRTDFPAPVVEEARRAAARGPRDSPRADLTALETLTIDGPWTVELDDAVSLEPLEAGGVRLGVHIADPAAFVERGGAVDEEALRRAVTYYFPERRLPMLPPILSEDAASLVEGTRRPALSFLVELDLRGEIAGFEIVRSWIRVAERLEYAEADRRIEAGGPRAGLLRALDDVARRREAARLRAGAVILRVAEVDVRVGAAGEIELRRVEPGSPSRRIVAEAMILAGTVAAAFAAERRLPAIHRRQAAAAGEGARRGEVCDLLEARALRRTLRRAEVGLAPGPHAALGVPAYAQVTSPLRRYQDLATHRQIVAALEGLPPPYDTESLQRVAASTERAEAEGRRAEAAATRYWLLRYLERFVGRNVEAIVVETRPQVRVLLCETLLEEPVPALVGAVAAERVALRVERVRPRAGELVLRPAGGRTSSFVEGGSER